MGQWMMFNVVRSIPRLEELTVWTSLEHVSDEPSETTLHPIPPLLHCYPPPVQDTLPGIPVHDTCHYETPVWPSYQPHPYTHITPLSNYSNRSKYYARQCLYTPVCVYYTNLTLITFTNRKLHCIIYTHICYSLPVSKLSIYLVVL